MIENPNIACLFRGMSELLNLATTKKQIWSVVRTEAWSFNHSTSLPPVPSLPYYVADKNRALVLTVDENVKKVFVLFVKEKWRMNTVKFRK